MKRAVVLLSTVVVIAVLIWAGVHNLRARRRAMQQAQEGKLMLQGVTSAEQEMAASKLLNQPAPGFTLVNLEGKKVSLSDYKGKPVIVNYWATYCVPCKEEMPWLEEFRKQYAGQGLEVLGIDSSSDDRSKDKVSKTVQGFGVTFPILLADDTIEDTYGVDVLPTSYYVNGKGVVVQKTAGVPPVGGKEALEANIKKLLAGGA